jgi:hydrogenase maturation protease
MNLATVFATVRSLGGKPPPTLVVGCEPESIEPGIGLSPIVHSAIPGAIDLIRELIARLEVR